MRKWFIDIKKGKVLPVDLDCHDRYAQIRLKINYDTALSQGYIRVAMSPWGYCFHHALSVNEGIHWARWFLNKMHYQDDKGIIEIDRDTINGGKYYSMRAQYGELKDPSYESPVNESLGKLSLALSRIEQALTRGAQ